MERYYKSYPKTIQNYDKKIFEQIDKYFYFENIVFQSEI